jgi:hypothetical protein
MPAPTITSYFGTAAQVVTDLSSVTATISASNPALVIPFSGLNATGLTEVASMAYADPLALAILKLIHIFTKSDVDELTSIEILDPTLNLGTRGGKVVEVMDYRLSAYRARSQVVDFDPDQLRPDYVP